MRDGCLCHVCVTPAQDSSVSTLACRRRYDAHGNLTDEPNPGGGTTHIDYDANDHATSINDGTDRIDETLAPSGRVLHRVVTNLSTSTVTGDNTFGYGDGSDSPAWSMPSGGGTVTTYLPGAIFTGSNVAWELANAHGDIVGTADANGVFTPSPVVDEYGNTSGAIPAARLGWLGTKERFTTDPNLGIIRMGQRLYDPTTGRFLERDPIEAGSSNDYEYVNGDPINRTDVSGERPQPKRLSRAEEQALRDHAAGRRYNRRAYNSARQKQIYNEKIRREEARNAQKQRGQANRRQQRFEGPPDRFTVSHVLQSARGIPSFYIAAAVESFGVGAVLLFFMFLGGLSGA